MIARMLLAMIPGMILGMRDAAIAPGVPGIGLGRATRPAGGRCRKLRLKLVELGAVGIFSGHGKPSSAGRAGGTSPAPRPSIFRIDRRRDIELPRCGSNPQWRTRSDHDRRSGDRGTGDLVYNRLNHAVLKALRRAGKDLMQKIFAWRRV